MDDSVLLKAVFIKLVSGESVSSTDFKRFIHFLNTSNFAIETPSQDEVAALQSEFVATLQNRFMRGK